MARFADTVSRIGPSAMDISGELVGQLRLSGGEWALDGGTMLPLRGDGEGPFGVSSSHNPRKFRDYSEVKKTNENNDLVGGGESGIRTHGRR